MKKDKYFLGGALSAISAGINLTNQLSQLLNKGNDHAGAMPPLAMFQTQQFAMGGNPQVEVERGEVLSHNGNLQTIGGNRHENGGTPHIPAPASLPEFIFSDRIGFDENNRPTDNPEETVKTFADIVKNFGDDQIGDSGKILLQEMNDYQAQKKLQQSEIPKMFPGGDPLKELSKYLSVDLSSDAPQVNPVQIPFRPEIAPTTTDIGILGNPVNPVNPTNPTNTSESFDLLGLTNPQLGQLAMRLPALIGNAAIAFGGAEVQKPQLNPFNDEILSQIEGLNIDFTEQDNMIDRQTNAALDTIGNRSSSSSQYLANAQNVLANAMNAKAGISLQEQQANNSLAFQKAGVIGNVGNQIAQENRRVDDVNAANRGARLSNISEYLSNQIPALANQVGEFDVYNRTEAFKKEQAIATLQQNYEVLKAMYSNVGADQFFQRMLKQSGFSKEEIKNITNNIRKDG